LLSLAVAAIVLVAAVLYIAQRDETWQSSAKVVLVPHISDSSERGMALGSWDGSASIGTYEELIGSSDVLEQANDVSTSVDVRPVPDSRVLDVTATGPRETVQSDLDAILSAAKDRGFRFNDLWTLQVLDAPSAPTTAGASTLALILAALAVAVVAGLAAFVLIGAIRDWTTRRTHPPGHPNGKLEPGTNHVPAAASMAPASPSSARDPES
jgi:uncharacterized protein involved in exopolysaccharide biosynthesis